MNILIYGIGGVGGYFGARLAATEHHVTFIARGKHLEAIRENGLLVKSFLGDFRARPDLCTDTLNTVPQPDLVILGVKSWQLPEAARALRTILKPGTLVLPLQNGVDNSEKLRQFIPEQQILTGFCNLISFVEAPGIIRHAAFNPRLSFGETDNRKTERALQTDRVFRQAGINSSIPEDIHREIWRKFMFITTISGLGGLTRVPIGTIRQSAYLYRMMRDTAEEILAVARAGNIDLNPSDVDDVMDIINNQAPESTASTQRDIMAGKPSELENFNGYIVREAKKLGIPVPVNEMIFECLLPMEKKARETSL
ncbi:ketopantoate reductase family protein [Sinomicrobium soli]|uniref:ketopantoate reductase family protein n=1 Tax=Sinomicrobium sp. N-1-3-6 TaxID=2219864 RepID=UPI000DCEBB93|nr:2-dehydropantoate 2-reductase [Sinomicrobium sp. N-1-3-6]RAV30014.1 2-dehydropantoate 2-reductase [Sinomicrobium sp. N-1-3-6]